MRILVFSKSHHTEDARFCVQPFNTRLGRRSHLTVYQVNNVPDDLTVTEALQKVTEMPLPEDSFQFDWPDS